MDGTVLTAAAYDVACSSQEADILALAAFEAGQFAGVCNRRIKATTWPRLTTRHRWRMELSPTARTKGCEIL
jgi:hypothetical protein